MARKAAKRAGVVPTERTTVRLAGVQEAAAILSISKSALYDRIASDPDFPAPVARLACGQIWLEGQLLDYAVAYDRTRNWFRARARQ